jgi:hypothetical protein
MEILVVIMKMGRSAAEFITCINEAEWQNEYGITGGHNMFTYQHVRISLARGSLCHSTGLIVCLIKMDAIS